MEDESTWDSMFKGSPFLRGLIENKIEREVEKAKAEKDIEIASLKEELTLAKDRVRGTEDAINMILEVI